MCNKLIDAVARLRRIRNGEKQSIVYGTTPEIIDGPANSWYETDHIGDMKKYWDEQLVLNAYLDGENIC